MAFPLGRQKGIFLSLDVSVALLVIFTAVMLSFAYFSQIESYGPSNLLTRGYLQDAVSVMSNRGDFAIPLISKNRPDTTGISEVLAATPSSVCMQVEAYGVSVPDGLEAYWKLDEDTGATTVADSSGNGVVGAINGSVYFSQPSRTGLAILFDGSTGLISASVPALSGAYTFTEAAWVNFKSLPNAFPSIITRNGTLDGAIFLVQTGSHAGVQTGSTWTAGSTELSPNTWYHIAATYDGTTVRLYVDGQLDGSYAYSSPLGSQDPVRVGALYSGSNAFNGTIDDVRIYSRALNSTEISQIYSNPTNLLYTVSKPDCEYSGGDTQVLQVPFTANQDQNQNAYYYAVVKAWGKGARGAAGVTVCGSLGQLCCSGNICTSGNICSGTTCVACGAVSQPCCSSSTCNSYLTCASGTCQCGGDGQPCCSGTTCNSGFACSASIICQACGTTGQLCCTGNTCDTGYVCLPNNPDTYRCSACGGTSQPCCSGNTCNFASLSCNTTSATCQSCGGSGQLCCTDNNCSATFACNTSFTPQPICTSCGASAGQLCCSGDNCTSPLACNTTATPQHVCYLNVSEVTCGILSTPNTVYTL
ncbi:MAG: hypothetical protein M0P42_15730, partial [Gallionella sp.]|nr:hypothetical protein [Gallionella sp.]